MYFYKLGYHTWESYHQIVLSNDKSYSLSEYEDILFNAYKESILILEEENRISFEAISKAKIQTDEYEYYKDWSKRIIIRDLLRIVISILTKDYGFSTLNYIHDISIDGDIDLHTTEPESTDSEFEKRLINYYQKELPRIRKIDSI